MFKKIFICFTLIFGLAPSVQASSRIDDFRARPPVHLHGQGQAGPTGLSPQQIKRIYNLPAGGGQGTIAIIGAYDDSTIENDLNVFSREYNLPACTVADGCLEVHKMDQATKPDAGWSLETSLDVEWSHAIAPSAKILLVEAKTGSGRNLLAAIDYAVGRPDVVAVSMSWGGKEFSTEGQLDGHFISPYGATFFASSGDRGWGVSWPAASPNVVAVGGTSLGLAADGTLQGETAWSGSGGGVSAYEAEPDFQAAYKISRAHGKRSVPDVAYDADPVSGFSVYRSSGKSKNNWYVLGGTSAGAPQWAGIKSLGLSASNGKFYADKASKSHQSYFRDIVSGKNGACKYYCEARARYDYVTGLGAPLTVNF